MNTDTSMTREEAKAEVNSLLKSALDITSSNSETTVVTRICQICQQHPQLAVEVDQEGNTLLEFLIQNSNILDSSIKTFLRHFPHVLSHKLSKGGFPLHLVCGVRRTLVSHFVDAYPDSVRVMDGKGKYPIHIFFDTKFPQENSSMDATFLQGLHRLLEVYPESIVTGDSRGRIPLQYVIHWGVVHREDILQCILYHAPRSGNTLEIRRLLTSGGKPLHAVRFSTQQASFLSRFFLHLNRLVFTPHELNGGWYEDWKAFFGTFTRLSQLTHLEIEIPYYLFAYYTEPYTVFAETLLQLPSLKSLKLSFTTRSFGRGDIKTPDMASLLVALIRQGNLIELIVREGIWIDPDPILNAIADNPKPPLTTLDLQSVEPNRDVTEALARMIASNGPLKSLAISWITFQQQPIFQALAGNTHLKSLRLPGLLALEQSTNDNDKEDKDNTTKSLSSVLRYHNVTLERILHHQNFMNLRGNEYPIIQHFTHLNRLGRATVRQETCSCQDIIKILEAVLHDTELPCCCVSMTSVVYDLLRECPFQWSSR